MYDDSNPHLSFLQGGGHGGSHPHLVHEFVRSILEDRTPVPRAIDGAYWTGVGTVSYTHLDVYKRQLRNKGCHSDVVAENRPRQLFIKNTGPVSYTHLNCAFAS